MLFSGCPVFILPFVQYSTDATDVLEEQDRKSESAVTFAHTKEPCFGRPLELRDSFETFPLMCNAICRDLVLYVQIVVNGFIYEFLILLW